MKYITSLHLLILSLSLSTLILSCSASSADREKNSHKKTARVTMSSFQEILDSAHVDGAIVIYGIQDSTYYSNNFDRADVGQLPASTYKIPHSIIALETGVIKSDSTVCHWDGQHRGLEIWEQDLFFKDAFRYSCVPCYQEIARKIGVDRMNSWLSKLKYPGMVVNETSLDIFWLQGESSISIMDQLDFLQRLYHSDLPISARNEQIIKRIMVVEQNESYVLRGKTGWSVVDGHNNGWFVGYLEKGSNLYFFALNIDATPETNMDNWPSLRRVLTLEAFLSLGLIDTPK